MIWPDGQLRAASSRPFLRELPTILRGKSRAKSVSHGRQRRVTRTRPCAGRFPVCSDVAFESTSGYGTKALAPTRCPHSLVIRLRMGGPHGFPKKGASIAFKIFADTEIASIVCVTRPTFHAARASRTPSHQSS